MDAKQASLESGTEGQDERDSFESLAPPDTQQCSSEEGERFCYFRNILMKCAEKCFAPARLEKISLCLADIRNKNPEAFDSIIQQLVDGLQVNIKQELELMIKQENLVSLCHELDQITETSKAEINQAWRPSGRPNEDIREHVMHVKLEFREKLKDKLKLLQDENKTLHEGVISMRNEVTKAEERITEKHMELQKIAEACDRIKNYNNDGKASLEKMMALP